MPLPDVAARWLEHPAVYDFVRAWRRREHLLRLIAESLRAEWTADLTGIHHWLFPDCVPAVRRRDTWGDDVG
jgi:hypothetical protein